MAPKKRDPAPSSDTSISAVPEAEPEVRTDATLQRAPLFPSETMITDLPAAPLRAQDTHIGAPPTAPVRRSASTSALPAQSRGDTDSMPAAPPGDREFSTVADGQLSAYLNPITNPASPVTNPIEVGTLPAVPRVEVTHLQQALDPTAPRGRSARQRIPAGAEPRSEEVTLPPNIPLGPSIHSSDASPQNTGFMRALARRRGLRERPQGMPRWAPEWSIPFFELPRTTQIVAGVGSSVVVVTLLFILVTTVQPGDRKRRQLAANPQVGRMYTEAKEAVLEHRYDEAVAALEAIRQITPDNEEALDYLAFAKKERDAKAILDRAKRELEGHRFDEARAAAKQVPEESESSTPAKALVDIINTEQGHTLLESAEALIKVGQVDAARASIAPLTQLDPVMGAQLSKEVSGAPIPTRSGGGGGHRNSAATEDAAVATELAPAFQTFNDDPSRAADQFEQLGRASRNSAVQKRAPALAAAARECGKTRASGLASGDASVLQNAYTRCSDVVADGPLATDLHEKAIAAYSRQAENGKAANNLGEASRAYRGLLAMRPGDAHARRELDALLAEAHTMYLNAYVLCDSDPDEAAKRLREVVNVLVPGDPDYSKAKERLDRLRPP